MARPPKTLPSNEPAQPTPEEIVASEVTPRKVAAFTALGVAILTVVWVVVEHLLSNKVPDFHQSDISQTFSAAMNGETLPPSFLTAVGRFKIDHATDTTLLAVAHAAGLLLMAPTVLVLLRAARVRGGTLGKFLEPISIVGFVLYAGGTLATAILEPSFYHHARDNGLSPGAIRTAYQSSGLPYAQIPITIGQLATGVPLALASIQSYRMGLLITWVGFFGVLTGMLFILPLDPTGVVQALWFSLAGVSIAGRFGGVLPAWETGVGVLPQPRGARQPGEPAVKLGKGGGAAAANAKGANAKGAANNAKSGKAAKAGPPKGAKTPKSGK